jgi:hypothetical protein
VASFFLDFFQIFFAAKTDLYGIDFLLSDE